MNRKIIAGVASVLISSSFYLVWSGNLAAEKECNFLLYELSLTTDLIEAKEIISSLEQNKFGNKLNLKSLKHNLENGDTFAIQKFIGKLNHHIVFKSNLVFDNVILSLVMVSTVFLIVVGLVSLVEKYGS